VTSIGSEGIAMSSIVTPTLSSALTREEQRLIFPNLHIKFGKGSFLELLSTSGKKDDVVDLLVQLSKNILNGILAGITDKHLSEEFLQTQIFAHHIEFLI